jgi:ribonuclease HII
VKKKKAASTSRSSTPKAASKSAKPKSTKTTSRSPSRTSPKKSAKAAKRNLVQSSFPDFVDDEDPAVVFARALGVDAIVAGLDEAGRGPLAGPVVAAACVLPVPLPEVLKPLNDSKQLTPEERDALYPKIVELALAYGVAVVESVRIDEINILRASLQAMAEALAKCEAMLQRNVDGAVIDGNMKAPLPERVSQRTVIGGDAKSRPIMAASILAKVTRDRRMIEEHARFPGYGFDAHKGYGTPQHLRALEKLGPCPLHRRSFEPVRVAEEGDMAALELDLIAE